MPITIIDTLSLKKCINPNAKSHPQPIDKAMSSMLFTERKDHANNDKMSTADIATANIESCFICAALLTAMAGPPVTCISAPL